MSTRVSIFGLALLVCVAFAIAVTVAARERHLRHTLEARIGESDNERARLAMRARASDFAARVRASGSAEENVALLEAALREDPSWGESRLALSIAYSERARELDPLSPDDAWAMRTRALDAAAAAIALGVGARGDFQRGEIHEELDDHASAREAYSEAARTASDADERESVVRYAALAAIGFREHRWADVIADTTKALAESTLSRSRPRAYVHTMTYRRAVAHLMRGATTEALADADRAIASRPDDARAWLVRSEIHLARGERREAAADLASAMRANARSARVEIDVARFYLASGDVERARVMAEEAVATGARIAEAFAGRAHVRLALGDREGAHADIDGALRLDPLLEDARRLGRALTESPSAEPSSVAQLLALAGEAWDLGDYDLAASRTERALASDPRDRGALVLRARLLLARHRDLEALAALDNATRVSDDPRLRTLRARARRDLALPDQGDAEKAVAAGDVSSAGLRERGIARSRAAATEKSRALAAIDLESALLLDPLDVEAQDALIALGASRSETRAPAN